MNKIFAVFCIIAGALFGVSVQAQAQVPETKQVQEKLLQGNLSGWWTTPTGRRSTWEVSIDKTDGTTGRVTWYPIPRGGCRGFRNAPAKIEFNGETLKITADVSSQVVAGCNGNFSAQLKRTATGEFKGNIEGAFIELK